MKTSPDSKKSLHLQSATIGPEADTPARLSILWLISNIGSQLTFVQCFLKMVVFPDFGLCRWDDHGAEHSHGDAREGMEIRVLGGEFEGDWC